MSARTSLPVSAFVLLACAACEPDVRSGAVRDASTASADDDAGRAASPPEERDAGVVLSADAGRVDDVDVDVDAGADAPAADAGQLASGGGLDAGAAGASPLAHDLALVVDADVDVAPTPINQAYVSAIDSTQAGDRILSFQKYFHSEPVLVALLDAARRGVEVRGLYRDELEPACESLLEPGDAIDCDALFVNAPKAHHKNMMVLRADGSLWGLVGSYNPRVRSDSSPRVHTVLTFVVDEGQELFDFYEAEAARLTGEEVAASTRLTVAVQGGGELAFTMHPGPASPALDLLDAIGACEGTLWVSYFNALADTVGAPVFDRLEELVDEGCDVRVLLDEANALARLSLLTRGVPVQFPTFPAGGGTLGHKIVSVVSGGETHLLQGSANLDVFNHGVSHNLTVYARVPASPLTQAIDDELSRYWVP
jgi:hypothetical protein